jgi:hypothetical protein
MPSFCVRTPDGAFMARRVCGAGEGRDATAEECGGLYGLTTFLF